jgi:putative ABC transport system permease protein
MTAISLSTTDLALAALLILAMAGCSVLLQLHVGRKIIISATRLIIQLTLVGMVLKAVFEQNHFIWVGFIAMVMLLVAGWEMRARQKYKLAGWWGYGIGTLSIFISSFAVSAYGLICIIGADPWYEPRYAIPVLGMLLGNTMNGIALTVDRLTSAVWQQRSIIEQRLMLGQDSKTAIRAIARDSLRNGMIPIINAMAAAGIVSLPGMMTGQILAGAPPVEAVKYQIVIWLMIASGAGFGMMAALHFTAKRLFDERHRLRLDRIRATPG